MDNNNTIAAFHIRSHKDGILKLNTSKLYRWHIPKFLRKDPIQKGDIVLVASARGLQRVLVMDVFREEFEETQRQYKRVVKVIERAPQKEPVV
jgi:hypothetical protein